MSRSDFETRKDVLCELLYYVFDSYLIPLIRSHFYVTESNAHRNQLFYFRHDVWKSLSEPALNALKLEMFEECNVLLVLAKFACCRRTWACGLSSTFDGVCNGTRMDHRRLERASTVF
jgi:telomerase reverse transcriptase